MYVSKVKNYELFELYKAGIFIDGFSNDSDKPIKVLYTSDQKPILYFDDKNLELLTQITKELNIDFTPIPVHSVSLKDFFNLLENDKLETLIN